MSKTKPGGTTRVFIKLPSEVYEKLAVHEMQLRKASALFRSIVQETVADPSRREELRRYYRQHSEFFDRSVPNARSIQPYLSTELLQELLALACDVVRRPNLCLVSRILFYRYAVQTGWAPPPPANKQKARLSHLPVPAVQITPVGPLLDRRSSRRISAFSIDRIFMGSSQTRSDLVGLGLLLHLGQSATIRYLIEKCAEGSTYLDVRRFFYREYAKLDSVARLDQRLRYRTTKAMNALLDKLSQQVLGKNNHSRALRTIIAWAAHEYGLRGNRKRKSK